MTNATNSHITRKPPNVRGIRELPQHWRARRLGKVVELRVSNVDKHTKEEELPVRLCNYVDVYKNDRITQQIPFMAATASADEIWKFRLHQDDVLITKDSEAWNDIGVPALVTEPADDLISGYHLAILRPREGSYGPYLFWALQSKPTAYQFHAEAKGVTRYGLSQNGIQSVNLPFPPLEEQAAIVRFLDHADEQIRRYIASKERLIALLEEERQALVHQAVTRGLDPSVRLKPSGVEWLGDVPEHWGIQRLKTVCGMKSGEGITAMSIENEGEYPVYGGNGLRGYTSEFTHDGDYVLIGRQGALCGNVHIARGQFWASEHAVVTTVYTGHILEWLSALLEVMDLNQYSIAAAQPGLAVERVLNLWVPVPPHEEQENIAASIGKQTKGIDNTGDQARRQINLMNEYRTRLIADVVTGQLDVREAAAQLPAAP